MQTEQTLIRCDICGKEFTVSHEVAGRYRWDVIALCSYDYDPAAACVDNEVLDLCPECARKAASIRVVSKTREEFIGGHDQAYARIPTGKKTYSLVHGGEE